MSDFCHPSTQHRARVNRLCVYCAESINKGDWYTKQSGVWEGSWFTNHFHDECFKDLCDGGEGEFTPYSNERPEVAAGHSPEDSPAGSTEQPAPASTDQVPSTSTGERTHADRT